jgi:hypothetical protein
MTVREIIKRPGKTKSLVSLKVGVPSIKIVKYIAPKVMVVCGKYSWTPSPCECTDTITCAYCVQASLMVFKKKLDEKSEEVKEVSLAIIDYGKRKTAREFGVQPNSVMHWLNSGNIPEKVMKRFRGVQQPIQSP